MPMALSWLSIFGPTPLICCRSSGVAFAAVFLRAAAGFATQFWFYMQIYALGRTGKTDPGLSVFKAWRSVEKEHKERLQAMRAA